MRTLTIGDIHGNYKALLQCLDRSNFDKETDTLITLGDIADGWHQVPECVEELLTIPNRIDVKGNHDSWLEDWLNFAIRRPEHKDQGGDASIAAYLARPELIQSHLEFFRKQVPYYIDSKNRLFVHGGINWHKELSEQDNSNIMWDRHMYQTALQWESFALTHPTHPKNYFKGYKEIFIGHTSTNHVIDYRFPAQTLPVSVVNLHNLDTGAGWDGKLTIMDIDTKEFWQSDLGIEIYPEEYNSRSNN